MVIAANKLLTLVRTSDNKIATMQCIAPTKTSDLTTTVFTSDGKMSLIKVMPVRKQYDLGFPAWLSDDKLALVRPSWDLLRYLPCPPCTSSSSSATPSSSSSGPCDGYTVWGCDISIPSDGACGTSVYYYYTANPAVQEYTASETGSCADFFGESGFADKWVAAAYAGGTGSVTYLYCKSCSGGSTANKPAALPVSSPYDGVLAAPGGLVDGIAYGVLLSGIQSWYDCATGNRHYFQSAEYYWRSDRGLGLTGNWDFAWSDGSTCAYNSSFGDIPNWYFAYPPGYMMNCDFTPDPVDCPCAPPIPSSSSSTPIPPYSSSSSSIDIGIYLPDILGYAPPAIKINGQCYYYDQTVGMDNYTNVYEWDVVTGEYASCSDCCNPQSSSSSSSAAPFCVNCADEYTILGETLMTLGGDCYWFNFPPLPQFGATVSGTEPTFTLWVGNGTYAGNYTKTVGACPNGTYDLISCETGSCPSTMTIT